MRAFNWMATVLAFLPGLALAGVSGKGFIEDQYHYRSDEQPGQSQTVGHRWEGKLEAGWWHENWSVDAVFLGRHRNQYAHAGGELEDRLGRDADIHELYGTWAGARWQARLGKQQIAWGRADYFRLVDVLNPLDLREFLLPYLDDYALGREPRDMATLEYFGDSWEHQLVIIPDQQPTRLPPPGSDFALQGAAVDAPTDIPDVTDVGWRGRTFYGRTGLDFYAFHGLSPERKFRVTPSGGVRAHLERRTLLGLSFSRPTGEWVTRGDLVHRPQEFIQTPRGPKEIDESAALIGLDWTRREWTLNLQATANHRHQNPEGAGPATIREASITVLKDWTRRRLDMEVIWLYRHHERDSHLGKATLGYKPRQNWRAELGFMTFQGPSGSFYGRFDQQDRFFAGIRWNFSYQD